MTNKESLCEEKLLVYDALTRSCDIIKQWVDKFSLFYSVQTNERDRLYSNSLLEQIVFRTATRLDGDRVVLCSGIVVHKVQLNYLLGDVAQQIYDYGSALKTYKIDAILSATLASILLLDSNNPGRRETRQCHSADPLSLSARSRLCLPSNAVVIDGDGTLPENHRLIERLPETAARGELGLFTATRSIERHTTHCT